MIVVAHLANTNGMASWCWEAACALHEAGIPVTLVAGTAIELPGSPGFEVIRLDEQSAPRATGVMAKVRGELGRLSAASTSLLRRLYDQLRERGITPIACLLNQSTLQDPSVPVPQFVVAWAYPTTFTGYFVKALDPLRSRWNHHAVREFLELMGWWAKDWRAYRSATLNLAVTHRIADSLRRRGVGACVVHPGTCVSPSFPTRLPDRRSKVLLAATVLDEPRKGIRWALANFPTALAQNCQFTLVGSASAEFQSWVAARCIPVEWTGRVPRETLSKLMGENDLFVFASSRDDWGYVLIEAMSQGMIVVAPDISPFDEIIGDAGILYDSAAPESFAQAIAAALSARTADLPRKAWERASRLFSRSAFAAGLQSALDAGAAQVR